MSYLLPIAAGAALIMGVQGEKNPYDTAGQDGAYFVPSIGAYNVFTDNDRYNDDTEFMGGAEYRFSNMGYGVRPVIGAHANAEGDLYGYAGFVMDVPLYKDRFWFIPGAAIGAYHHEDGFDLGGALEFRTSAELAYRFDNNHRLGVAIAHISNADIYDNNPGTENITVNYSIPVSSLW